MADDLQTSQISRRRLLKTGAGATACLGGYLFGNQADQLRIERNTLRLPNFQHQGIRVALVADLHANEPISAARAQRALRMAIEENPDVILMAGDYLDYPTAESLQNLSHALLPLTDTSIPCLATFGNHDYCIRSGGKIDRQLPEQIFSIFTRMRVQLLRNQVQEVQGVPFWGIDDALVGLDRYDLFTSGLPQSVVAILHEPDAVDRLPKGVSLMLAGHSHGGQVCLPGGIPMHVPAGARRYISGFYPRASTPLYVTRGVGSKRHIRVCCAPEVSLLELQSA